MMLWPAVGIRYLLLLQSFCCGRFRGNLRRDRRREVEIYTERSRENAFEFNLQRIERGSEMKVYEFLKCFSTVTDCAVKVNVWQDQEYTLTNRQIFFLSPPELLTIF